MNNDEKQQYSFTIIQSIMYLSQLGLSIITPILLLIGGAIALNKYLNVGTWIFIVAIFLGLGGSVSVFFSFMKHAKRLSDKQKDVTPTSFNN